MMDKIFLWCLAFLAITLCCGDEIDLTDDSRCKQSNYCQKPVLLKKKTKRTGIFNLSNDAWDAVKSTHTGTVNKDVKLTIKLSVLSGSFETRELSVNVKHVKYVQVKYIMQGGPPNQIKSLVPSTKTAFEVVSSEERHVVKSLQLIFKKLKNKNAVNIKELQLVGCGDKTGFGKKRKGTPAKTLNQPARKECVIGYTLNYNKRNDGYVSLIGEGKQIALEGSKETYTGNPGQDVNFKFIAESSPGEKWFVWWRVCFLVRHVKEITFTLEGDTDTWKEHMTVCDASSYLWVCYNPRSPHFELLEEGHISLKPDPASPNAKISVQQMSIAVCFDGEFNGEMVRIGTIPPQPGVDNTFCSKDIGISRSNLTRSKSQFYMSDVPGIRNTKSAWTIVGNTGQEFNGSKIYTMKLKTKCKGAKDGRFQARKIEFWAQHIKGAVIRYCDTKYIWWSSYCNLSGGILGPGGVSRKVNVVTPHAAKKYEVNVWQLVTHIEVTFKPAPGQNPLTIWSFSLSGCCDKAYLKRIVEDDGVLPGRPKPKVTVEKCKDLESLVYPGNAPGLRLNDRDPKRDETKALRGSGQTYKGADGKNVLFYIKYSNPRSFECWEICGEYLNVKQVTYIMERDGITFVQTKKFSYLHVWQKTCYQPLNRDLIVRRVVVMFEVVPDKAAMIKQFQLKACMDHLENKYCTHIHHCDYKFGVITTPRNQKITIYGSKDEGGRLKRSELYHYTDNTGNDGDNTWFMVDPVNSLVTAIWTENTKITLNWDIRARQVSFEVFAGSLVKLETRQTILDLEQLKLLDPRTSKFNFTRPELQPNKLCVTIPLKAKECGKDEAELIATANVKAKREFMLPARYLSKTKEYEFIFPKGPFQDNDGETVDRQCSSITKVFRDECKWHGIFTRIQHQFICDHIKKLMTKENLWPADVSRVYQACLYTYKVLRMICRVMTERPVPDAAVFFQRWCKTCIRQLYRDFFDDNPITIEAQAIDSQNRVIATVPKVVNVNLSANKQVELRTATVGGGITIYGLISTLLQSKDPKSDLLTYKVCVDYGCEDGNDEESMTLSLAFSSWFCQCRNLATKPCCCDYTLHKSRVTLSYRFLLIYFGTIPLNMDIRHQFEFE